MMPVRSTLALACLVLTSIQASAATPGATLAGDRSYAMGGAHRGLGTSNDTLFLNPAGMAAVRRYGLDLQYGKLNADDLQYLAVSVVDSKSGPIAGGIAFEHTGSQAFNGGLNQFYIGAAYAISDNIAFGFTLRNLRGGYDAFGGGYAGDYINAYTGDVGLMVTLVEGVSVGASYTNVAKSSASDLLPGLLGFGLGVTLGEIALAADVSMPTTSKPERYGGTTWHAGAEYFLLGMVPVRVGYTRERVAEGGLVTPSYPYRNYVSGGLGWAAPGGSLELAYRRSTDVSSDWGILGGFKIFI